MEIEILEFHFSSSLIIVNFCTKFILILMVNIYLDTEGILSIEKWCSIKLSALASYLTNESQIKSLTHTLLPHSLVTSA